MRNNVHAMFQAKEDQTFLEGQWQVNNTTYMHEVTCVRATAAHKTSRTAHQCWQNSTALF